MRVNPIKNRNANQSVYRSGGRWPLPLLSLLVAFTALMLCPPGVMAQTEVGTRIDSLNTDLEEVKKRLDQLEEDNEKLAREKVKLQKRLDKAELHTATDKLSFGVDLRTRADTLHYDNIRVAPAAIINGFFTPVDQMGFNGATLPQIQQGMANMAAAGMVPPPEEVDADNDIIYTNRLRLDMKSKVNEHLSLLWPHVCI